MATEVEALQLEYNWIKEFDPRFNVRYRDDKSYPSLAVTLVRGVPAAARDAGPEAQGRALLRAVLARVGDPGDPRPAAARLSRRAPARRACSSAPARSAGRACSATSTSAPPPAWAGSSASEHRRIVEEFCDFMAGSTTPYLRRLRRQMDEASQATEYERAARLRDDIRALERALEKQAVVLGDGTDADVIGIAEDALEAAVQVFHVRGGRVRGQRGMVVDKVEDVTTGEVVERFLEQFYGAQTETAPRRRRLGGPAAGLRGQRGRRQGLSSDARGLSSDAEGLSSDTRGLASSSPTPSRASCSSARCRRGLPGAGVAGAPARRTRRPAGAPARRQARPAGHGRAQRGAGVHPAQAAPGQRPDGTLQGAVASCRRRWVWPRRRCGSSASTCRTCRATTWSRPWSCSRTGWRASRSTGVSRSAVSAARMTSPACGRR